MTDKIRISWDDVNRPEVDAAIKHQETLQKAQQHVQTQLGVIPPTPATLTRAGNPWLNAPLFMTVFGILGALVAWGLGEVAMSFEPKEAVQLRAYLQEFQAVEADANAGRINWDQAENRRKAIEVRLEGDPEFQKNSYVRILTNKLLNDRERDDQLQALEQRDRRQIGVANLIFLAACGIAMAIGLSVAEPIMNRNSREAAINGSVAAILGLVGGAIVWLFAERLYRALGGGNAGPTPNLSTLPASQVFARAISWGVLGSFFAIAPGIILKSSKKMLIGLIGGFIGGFVGGLFFDPIYFLTFNVKLSRFIALLVIGGATGAAIGLIENAVKSGWLRVVAGLIVGKQFILYRNPTTIGSSPLCEIYLFKDPNVQPQHAAVKRIAGGFEIQNIGGATLVNGVTATQVRLKNNDQIQVGGTTFVFQEKQSTPLHS